VKFESFHPISSTLGRSGFTLVEILVVVAVLGLLAGVSMGAYQKTMAKASMGSEISAAKNLIQAYQIASVENGGRLLPAKDPAATGVKNANGQNISMAEVRSRYPFRLAPYFNYQLDGTVLVNRNESQIVKMMGSSGLMYDYGVSVFPAMGINRYLVGGNLTRKPDGGFEVQYSEECVQSMAQADQSVIVFVSAGNPDIDGYEYVTAPLGPGGQWSSAKWSKGVDAGNYGHVDGRFDGKAACAFLDGSVRILSIDELRDMRLWSRKAALENNPAYQPR
jgi:prepilin-type N-terminal cleavage/methylation domain-containing protein